MDCVGLEDLLASVGTVRGAFVLAGYHRRDAAAVARRHGVAVHLPASASHLWSRIDAPTEIFEGKLTGTPFRAVPVFGRLPWGESVLYDPGRGTLVATEVLVASERLTGPGVPLAVSPYARLWTQRAALGDLAVDRVFVGHGDPVLEDDQAALHHALANAYRGLPGYLRRNFPYGPRGGTGLTRPQRRSILRR